MTQTLPALAALGLSANEIDALSYQGTICREARLPDRTYAKLRYRIDGKQRVKYLGRDEAFVSMVEKELAALQARSQAHRELVRLAQEAEALLRSLKPRLESLLNEHGYVFHGRAIRKPRGQSPLALENLLMDESTGHAPLSADSAETLDSAQGRLAHQGDFLAPIGEAVGQKPDWEDAPVAVPDPCDQRIAEYLDESLARPSVVHAVIGIANTDMLSVACRLKRKIDGEMDAAPASLEDYGRWKRPLGDLLKLHKQIEHFFKLEMAVSAAAEQAAQAAAERASKAAQSEETAD